MCGICGVAYFDGSTTDKRVLEEMRDSMTHRGPDDSGVFIDGPVGVGHRRLSIIDLGGGRQPMANEDESVWVAYNGEIYNHEVLRVELESLGHRYSTNSDTETIVHLYEEYGVSCVEKMNGMFAFALWDSRDETLFLARDRLGIKPLYYMLDEKKIVFASELKAILAHPEVERNINPPALRNYLAFGYTASPKTVFKEIKSLQPARTLAVKKGLVSEREYWRLSYASRPYGEEAYHAEKIREMLKESVKLRLMSDVPLGAFLSGGIDSSLIVALMSEVSDEVKTFSVGFEDSSFNELEYARVVAEEFNTDHHEFRASFDALKILPKLLSFYDEPFADSSAVPTYIVSEMARSKATVCLSGDGGDELFGGYDRYAALKLAHSFAKVPAPLRSAAAYAAGFLPESTANKNFVNLGKRFVQGLSLPPEGRYGSWITLFDEESRGKLLRAEASGGASDYNPNDYLKSFYRECDAKDFLAKTMYVDIKTYLPEDLLVKVDRASMAHSLEVRVPFLDHKLVEYAQNIPADLKIRGLNLKYLLKKSAKDVLPKKIVSRKKHGFGVPVGAWFKNELKSTAYDILTGRDSPSKKFFNKKEVEKILDEHCRGRRDNGQRIWSLMFFDLWHRKYVNGEKIRL